MDAKFTLSYKICHLSASISRVQVDVMKMQKKIKVLVAAAKSLKLQRYRRRQLGKVMTLEENEKMTSLKNEIEVYRKVEGNYQQYIKKKMTELKKLQGKLRRQRHSYYLNKTDSLCDDSLNSTFEEEKIVRVRWGDLPYSYVTTGAYGVCWRQGKSCSSYEGQG